MEPAQNAETAAAVLYAALPRSFLTNPSDASNASASTSGTPATWREFAVAECDAAAQHPITDPARKFSLTGRSGRCVSPSPGPGRASRPNQQAVQNPVGNTMNVYSKPRGSDCQNSASGCPFPRSLDPGAQNSQWKSWNEVQVKVFGLPPNTLTRDLALWFRDEGIICAIEIFRNKQGFGYYSANLIFRPPPARPFWNAQRRSLWRGDQEIGVCQLRLGDAQKPSLLPSPARSKVYYPETMTMKAEVLDFGLIIDEQTVLGMKKVTADATTAITFQANLFYKELNIRFRLHVRDWRCSKSGVPIPNHGKLDREEDFRFKVPFRDLTEIREMPMGPECFALLITLEVPPKFFKFVDDPGAYDDQSRIWKDRDSWYRQTDVVYNPSALKRRPLSLQKSHTVLDLGRWITYRLVFNMANNEKRTHQQIRNALLDYGVKIVSCPNLELVDCRRPAVWELIDRPSQQRRVGGGALGELSQDDVQHLSFQVRYQLEVCISHGYFNEYTLGREFIMKLAEMQPAAAQDLLEFIANQKSPLYQPMSLFNMKAVSGSSSSTKIPDSCVLLRSATVTPTTIYFHTPTVETSNLVIRQYAEHADRFLRVRFTDERSEGKIFSTTSETMNEVFTRIKRTLTNGIRVGDRHYEFLAFGNSQFREHGAYFFAPTFHVDAKRIRMWMGSFQDIKIVAKYASRLGQCFSTTRAITSVTPHIEELTDIWHNGFCFTDGVGRISPFLAQLAAAELGILQVNQEAPSAFQFRLGGCKGVLAVSPTSKARELHLRFSQYKFPASHEGLDIIRWSQFACAKLNQQLILVLSALGVPDDVFKRMMQIQLNDLKQAMTDSKKALSLLQKFVDHNQITLTLASMIIDGFQDTGEPFMLALLQLWRAWSTKYLKEKAQIAIGKGALLLGCVDETDILRGHYDDLHNDMPGSEASIEDRSRYIPQIFVQVSRDPENGRIQTPKVILGPMLLARNPSLHPGDIRVVCGVDVPELHHLKDVIVLPQNGDRDLASMCSGGDLDGDDFIVIWDHNLLPKEWNHEPMDYSPPPPLCHDSEITVDDLTTFFVTYMKNDALGQIAMAHRAWADFSNDGVKDERCQQLTQLHSKAVDFPKTGQSAQMTQDLQPRKWPHFMQRRNAKKDRTYTSHKILGQLYDQVERTDFIPDFSRPFSRRILDAYALESAMLSTARQLKKDYDAALCSIMAKLDIRTEFEVWSTFALSHNRLNDFKFHEEIGQLSMNLKVQYRDLCVKAAGGKNHDQLGPFVAAMYYITAEETAEAVKGRSQMPMVDGRLMPVRQMRPGSLPMISFPWIFHDALGRIANPTTMSSCHELLAKDTTELQVTRSVPKKGRNLANIATVLPELTTAQGVIHQGDLFELFTSQHKTDPEVDKGEEVTDPISNGLSTPSEVSLQTSTSELCHASTGSIVPSEGSSLVNQEGDASNSEELSDYETQTPASSHETENTIKFPSKTFALGSSAGDEGLFKGSHRDQILSMDSREERPANGTCSAHRLDAPNNIETGLLDVNNTNGGSSSDAEIEYAEEAIVHPVPGRRSVNKLLEALAFQGEEDEEEKVEEEEQ